MLRDRKVLLRFLDAVMGSDGLFAMDHVARSCWSRTALGNELRHDAALDIAALFTVHLVTGDDKEVFWLHSHGLREIGFCDFDVIAPHPSSHSTGYDSMRALGSVASPRASRANVTAVGSDGPAKRELESAALARADKVVADSLAQCLRLGEIHHAVVEGVLRPEDVYADLGELATGLKPGRTSDAEITIADLTGVGVQDAAVADFVTAAAMKRRIGETLALA